MTTITYKNKTICTDTQITSGFTKEYGATKAIKKDGVIIAMTGCACFGEFAAPIILKHAKKTKTPKQLMCKINKDARLKKTKWPTLFIILHPRYLIGVWENDGFSSFDMKKPHAWGSGGIIALTAMDIGWSAKKALKLAMKKDCFTGGKIMVYKL